MEEKMSIANIQSYESTKDACHFSAQAIMALLPNLHGLFRQNAISRERFVDDVAPTLAQLEKACRRFLSDIYSETEC